jgi:uncharacterized protein (TIGR02328 family)
MRLWHKDFISVLPREQLVAQWRELSAIAGAIQKNGTPNNILVNFVLNYDYDHFINYAGVVRTEMNFRGYRTMNSVWEKITSLKPDWDYLSYDEIYKEKMDNTYLDICFYNLYEKILCSGIKESDSSNIIKTYCEKRGIPNGFR